MNRIPLIKIEKEDVNDEYEAMQLRAKSQLHSLGIKYSTDLSGTFKFVVPKTIEKELKRIYNFSLEELTVGADMPLGVLARHVDEQSAHEARSGIVAEFLRHYFSQVQMEYEEWYNVVFYKAKQLLGKGYSDKSIHSYVISKHRKKYRKWQQNLCDAEFAYRLMNNAIRAAWITKGRLLQTLRVIIQGNKESLNIGLST